MPHDWTVKILSKYNRQYTGGGDFGLIDGIRGTLNFASGEWQGYQSQDFEAVIDLKETKSVSNFNANFLQDSRSWILMPTQVEFFVSTDNINFTSVGSVDISKTSGIKPMDDETKTKDFGLVLVITISSQR